MQSAMKDVHVSVDNVIYLLLTKYFCGIIHSEDVDLVTGGIEGFEGGEGPWDAVG